jgi:hypothetical protein
MNETQQQSETGDPAKEPTDQYVTGIKLFSVVLSVTAVVFLLMLDMSILSTVSLQFTLYPYASWPVLIDGQSHPTGDPADHDRLSLPAGCWLVHWSISALMVCHWHRRTDIPLHALSRGCMHELTSLVHSAAIQPMTGKLYVHFRVKVSSQKLSSPY